MSTRTVANMLSRNCVATVQALLLLLAPDPSGVPDGAGQLLAGWGNRGGEREGGEGQAEGGGEQSGTGAEPTTISCPLC